ncbi:MAG TPA: 3-deoxy-7-phosphoheptulonate synthase, partial [Candidatus Dormibacteraeota bacterium]|nr:3-deoxy-7-phosphoheptulonate synthase [Candidatus Dormibacteraeota bacterium]
MLILMRAQASEEELEGVRALVKQHGFRPVTLPGEDRVAIGVLGSNPSSLRDLVISLPGVVDAVPVSKPFKLVGREFHPEPTVVRVGDVDIGAGAFTVMAGPCS